MSSKFDAFLQGSTQLAPVSTVVAHPCSDTSIQAVIEAARTGIIAPTLIGPAAKICSLLEALGQPLDSFPIIDEPHSHAAAARAVALVREGKAQLLMKGSLHTDELMQEVTAKDLGLRTERRISHVFILDVPTYHKPLYITDAAINIFPTLADKVDIVKNAIELAHALGVAQPKVAILSAVETVTPKIPSTIEAAALCKMAERGQITGAIIDGPLAFDNAISAEAARAKGFHSPVAGDPDILVVPDLEAGNMLAKQLTFLLKAECAGIVLGARVPIVLTSRADSVPNQVVSCAIGAMLACAQQRKMVLK